MAEDQAAFGVFPQMKPRRGGRSEEDANVAIPRGLARGAISGVLGAPGDIESMVRMLPGLEEKTILPTSEQIEQRLPFKGTSPLEQAATGLGQLGGGFYTGPGAPVRLIPGIPKAAVKAGREFMESAGQTVSPLTVWHGSPHKFPPTERNPLGEFDPTKIGTGEGAQAYGHGHYSAEAQGVGEEYAKNLANRDMANQGRLNAHANAQRLASLAGDPKSAADDIRHVLQNEPDHPQKELLQNTLAYLESGDFARPLETKGHLYKIDLPDEAIDKMLDWDKPLNQQPQSVRDSLKQSGLLSQVEDVGKISAEKIRTLAQQPNLADWAKRDLLTDAAQLEQSKSPAHVAGVLKRMQMDYGITPEHGPFKDVANDFLSFVKGMQAVPNMDTGGGAMSFLQAMYGDAGAAQKLREAGIPGIKYLDRSSRGNAPTIRTVSVDGKTKYEVNPGWNAPNQLKFFDTAEEAQKHADSFGTRNFVVFPGEEKLLNILERKKEGGVVFSDNPDTMRLELMSPIKKAMGGEITADDLILEERRL